MRSAANRHVLSVFLAVFLITTSAWLTLADLNAARVLAVKDGDTVTVLVSSSQQMEAGLAWHYKQFQRRQSATDRATYGAAEDAARRAHIGLWADAHPVQPQDFRHRTQSPMCLDNNDHRIACSEGYDGPVRGNMRSHIYHWPGCPNYNDIAEHNRVEFANAIAAEKAGYRAALNCP